MYNNIVSPLNGKTLNIQDITGQKLLGKYIYQYNSELVKSVLATMRGGSGKAATKTEVVDADATPLDIEGALNSFKTEAAEEVEAGKIINVELLKKLYAKIGDYVTTLTKSNRVAYEALVHQKLTDNANIEFGEEGFAFSNGEDIEEHRIAFINFLMRETSGDDMESESEDEIPATHNLKIIQPGANGCVGEYKKGKALGKGIAGEVFLVKKGADGDAGSDEEFAMKEQSWATQSAREETIALNQIGNEIEIGTRMASHNLSPKIHDSYLCKSGGHTKVFIVMEIMNLGTLEEFSQENLIDEAFIQKLRDKVKKMHELKIFHRDLHAGNIFVHQKPGKGEVPEPYIGDFGTSTTFDNQMEINSKHEGNMYFLGDILPDPTKLIVRTMMAIEVL